MRKNQYNLHIRLDEDERAALEKGLQASGLPLSAYLRKLILGERIQAAPSEELRRLRTRDPSDRQQHQPACAESKRRVCQP